MANVFDFINVNEHIVAESSKLLATNYGKHMADIVMDKDRDNGTIVCLGARGETQTRVAKNAVAGEPLYLILTPPSGYNNDRQYYGNEKYFYNAKDEVARGYQLAEDDVFTVSENAITALATAPVEGNFVYWDAATDKYVETASAPTSACLALCEIVEKVEHFNSISTSASYRLQISKLNKAAD